MKKILLLLGTLAVTTSLQSQSNAPVRLAIVSETPEAGTAADMLTAEFSKNYNVHLLERAEIERVYREQGLSAGNRDYLKLGQVLGADGLLLVDTNKPTQPGVSIPIGVAGGPPKAPALTMNVQLIAVKPGVVLANEQFQAPEDISGWAKPLAAHLDPLLPKLSVLEKDAIPISVVNLRAAMQSAETRDLERQLTSLAIQRLSRERRLFVLERRNMQLLTAEKTLKGMDDSAFWDGSYLLEGTIDREGYSQDTVTITARLRPPKGGASLTIEASGSRTNLTDAINRLVDKVLEDLKLNADALPWNPADEAQQYFSEAQWAMKWGLFPQAQAAAESAWALGKQDLECSRLRITAYINALPEVLPPEVSKFNNQPGYRFVHVNDPPDPHDCDLALHALQCYYDFSRTSPEGVAKVLTRGPGWNDWHNSEWYQLGLDTLVAASQVLQHFYCNPQSQPPVAGKLSDLRAMARSVVSLISQSPTVRDSYFIGNRIATGDELYHTIKDSPNLFRCEVKWGCFWQENPENCIKLYRDLMDSPVFCRIHKDFWFRPPELPRLIAWNEADRGRLAVVWKAFLQNSDASSNVLLRVEGKATTFRDAFGTKEMGVALTNFFDALLASRCALRTNNIDVLSGVDDLIDAIGADSVDQDGDVVDRVITPENDALRKACSEYMTKLKVIDSECEKILAEQQNASAFEKQKLYLKANTPFVPNEFAQMFIFGFKDYSKTQALEIQPLLTAYKTNLTGTWARVGQMQVGEIEANVNRFLNSAASPSAPQPPVPSPAPKPVIAAEPASIPPIPPSGPRRQVPVVTQDVPTNAITVSSFLPIPLEGLPGEQISEVVITAHHWVEGKLLLDFQYGAFIYSFDDKGNWQSTRSATLPAIALLDPVTEHWKVIGCPEVGIGAENRFYHHSTLWHGEIYTCDGGQIRKFNEAKQAWEILKIPEVGNCELFVVNEHLYAATANLIVEILNGGTGTYILASNRRQPPVSSLDTETLGNPALFAGSDHQLRVATANRILAWNNGDWHSVCPAPQSTDQPTVSDDGVLFRADGRNGMSGIWRLATGSNRVEFCLGYSTQRSGGAAGSSPNNDSRPTWKLPARMVLPRFSAALRGPDLYLMGAHGGPPNLASGPPSVVSMAKTSPKNSRYADLFCFTSNDSAPQKLLFKFDREDAVPPVTADSRTASFMLSETPSPWFVFSSNSIFCGRETVTLLSIGGGDPNVKHPENGVWIVPLDQIDAEINRQKVAQLLSGIQAKQSTQKLLEKFDRNHNGVIDPDEREEALDDPAFIESELDKIDVNHNGILDPDEFSCFDANQNKILDPKEQAGIEIAQDLLGKRIMDEFDVNGNGYLRDDEFMNYRRSNNYVGRPGFSDWDANHDVQLSLNELETFVREETLTKFRQLLGPHSFLLGESPFGQPTGNSVSEDRRRILKTAVETYWQHPGASTRRSPFSQTSNEANP